jgi:hypothetical protein
MAGSRAGLGRPAERGWSVEAGALRLMQGQDEGRRGVVRKLQTRILVRGVEKMDVKQFGMIPKVHAPILASLVLGV